MQVRVPPVWRAAVLIGAASILAISAQSSPVGDFDAHGDVGAPKIAGSAAYNPVSQDYTLTAGGTNMWAERDEFHFVWKRMTGDFILQTRVELIGKGVDPHRKAGLIVRAGLDADAPYADAVVHGDGLTSLQFRRTKGAITEESRPVIKGADVLQLERKGTTFTFSSAKFGEPFVTTEVKDLNLGDEVLVGLALCSHNPAVVERAIFSNVRIIRPAKDGFVPYRDYIGSVLELLDVQSGRRQAIHRAEQPFEAPNWTPDGRALIYNGSGRGDVRGKLFRFDLATRQPVAIDTGTANRNNNDHVLSFDGTMLGISDQSEGQSAIYTLPAAGLPAEDRLQRPALALVGALIEDQARVHAGVLVPDVAFEAKHADDVQAAEIDITIVSLAYPVRDDPFAVAFGRRLCERARHGTLHLQKSTKSPTMRHCLTAHSRPTRGGGQPPRLLLRRDLQFPSASVGGLRQRILYPFCTPRT